MEQEKPLITPEFIEERDGVMKEYREGLISSLEAVSELDKLYAEAIRKKYFDLGQDDSIKENV